MSKKKDSMLEKYQEKARQLIEGEQNHEHDDPNHVRYQEIRDMVVASLAKPSNLRDNTVCYFV